MTTSPEKQVEMKLRALVGHSLEHGMACAGVLDATTYETINTDEWEAEYVQPWKDEWSDGGWEWRECWLTVEVPADLFAPPTLPSKVEVPDAH